MRSRSSHEAQLASSGFSARARVAQPDAGEDLVGQREVVGAEVRPVVEDREPSLGRLRVGDRGADHRLEHLVAVVLLQLGVGLARVDGAHVGDVHHHAEPLEVGVVELLRLLDHVERPLDALQGEVLGLGRDQRPVGGHQPVDGEQAERRRAVDEHDVVLLARVLQRLAQHQLAPHLARQRALDLGQDRARGHDPVVHGRLRLGVARQHVGDRRAGVRRDVEVVGQVALRVQVDGEDVEPDAPEHVGDRPHRGGLARAALERQDRDRLGHKRPSTISTATRR